MVKLPGKLAWVAFLLVLVACSADTKMAQISFVNLPEENIKHAVSWKADTHGLRLSAQIYALDRKILLLYGNLFVPGASIQSLLLRSEDGGKSWQETMSPVFESQVIRMFFLNKRVGWALVAWTVESPGDLLLYHTVNSGKTWQKLPRIPKRHYSGQPVGFGFIDERNGRIEMLYDGAAPTDGFAIMTTSDGGITWGEARSLSIADYKERLGKDKDNSQMPVEYVLGKDGLQWKLQVQSEEYMGIFARKNPESNWRLVSVIPVYFGYSDGQIRIPRADEAEAND